MNNNFKELLNKHFLFIWIFETIFIYDYPLLISSKTTIYVRVTYSFYFIINRYLLNNDYYLKLSITNYE